MYPIQIVNNERYPFLERFSFDFIDGNSESIEDDNIKIFGEAVFAAGKETLAGISNIIKECQDLLNTMIEEQDSEKKKFDPKTYWKNERWKKLENEIEKVFGFRHVEVHPFIEKYSSKDKQFESKCMNCEIYTMDRFPIEGLVTDKGFYDKSHNIIMNIFISLGLLKECSNEEIVAVFLHEFGHSIDPALVDISYTETNILSKYLTDRKKEITNGEKKFISKFKMNNSFIGVVARLASTIGHKVNMTTRSLLNTFTGMKRFERKNLEKLRKLLENEKGDFNRQNYGEAFADNFARMYGYGSQMASVLKKMDNDAERRMKSRVKKEKERQQAIMEITEYCMKDEHKTNVHRIRSLIREYEIDLKDPNISDAVKKQLKEDLDEVKKVFNEYLNNYDAFRNRVNNMINDELERLEGESSKDSSNDDTSAIKESTDTEYYRPVKSRQEVDLFLRAGLAGQLREYGHVLNREMEDFLESGWLIHIDKDSYITESKKAREKMQKEIDAVTSAERAEFYKLFGKSGACSLAKDKDGYYVRTHRARSDSYPEIKDIPEKDVKFVRSTS